MRVLLIKMSSLGDVVHALVGVTDAARARPGIVFDWVVEEAYQDIPKWHPTVRRSIVAPLRRWRKSPVRTVWSGEWKVFRDRLREEEYDVVLDAQGLLKSALVGQQARGPLAGRSASTAREPAAALLYFERIKVDLARTEVEQLRQLFAHAIGYEAPQSPADFGIERSQFPPNRTGPYAVFLHGAAWESKLWPEDRWIELGKAVREKGLSVLLPWGSEEERLRAQRIAVAINGEVLDRLGIPGMARLLANARFVVGLDTGLTHIAIALGTRTVTLYGPSVPVYDRVAQGELVNLSSSAPHIVDTSRPNTVPLDAALSAIRSWL
jgi:heptosyltransferase I